MIDSFRFLSFFLYPPVLYLFENKVAREASRQEIRHGLHTVLPRKIIPDAVLAIVNWQLGGILNQGSSFNTAYARRRRCR